ncbi:endonuclease [Gloeothece verrucosa]|uniref:Endonuclease I n=1 Tax=Gloeothece verrucosa (strain PCC 7822) TaxID=497965 RepID=E0UM72_GLOV7|nr:endonuclease [Gloeothece verrucosa]ADN18052.1 Endonuclease I [Gloeothece verrucosa PCC 7822]
MLHLLCIVIFIVLYSLAQFALAPAVLAQVKDFNQLSVATFNVENLDPQKEALAKVKDKDPDNVDDDVAKGKFSALAKEIVNDLQAPDIIALQEIQDNDGAELSSVVDASVTANTLIDAIKSAGGPSYLYRDIPPEKDQEGGQPGGNIRVAFLFNPARVKLQKLERFSSNVAFSDSRRPLVGEFTFNNNAITIINNHLKSKSGGAVASLGQRVEQAKLVNQFVSDLLETNPTASIIVLGDFNDTPDSPAVQTLLGTVLENLTEKIPLAERYSFIFKGNRELIDQILVSENLASGGQPEIKAVHVNAGKPGRASDHDPVIASFTIFPSSKVVIPPVSANDAPKAFIFPALAGNELLEQLDRQYSPLSTLGYGEARDLLYTEIDNSDGIVTDIYAGYAVEIDQNSSRPRQEATRQGINAEHVWPQSLGAYGPAKSDLHNLFAARDEINSARQNFPFADIPDNETTAWYLDDDELKVKPNLSNIDQYSEYKRATSFEPRESKKGDIARAMFYFRTVYPDSADQNFFEKQKQTLCKWQATDPVDEPEKLRSRKIAGTPQGNENPFILDSTLAERAFCE